MYFIELYNVQVHIVSYLTNWLFFVLKNAFYSLNYYNIHHQFGIDGSFFYITLVGIRSDQILQDQ